MGKERWKSRYKKGTGPAPGWMLALNCLRGCFAVHPRLAGRTALRVGKVLESLLVDRPAASRAVTVGLVIQSLHRGGDHDLFELLVTELVLA